MLSPEEIEQIERLISQRIEPLTEEIAALKAQLGKVDLLAIDNRNIRQSLGRIEAAQESTRLDSERQEKRSVRFEKQTGDQLTSIDNKLDGKIIGLQTQVTSMDNKLDGKIIGLQTEVRQRFTGVETVLAQILARLPEKP